MTEPRSLPLVALVLAVAVVVINAPVIAGGKTWADQRYHTEVTPARIAAADAVQHGTLPAWWEGSALGVPLAAEPTHGALYPPTWIAATPRALDLVTVLHFLWAALGIALWARRRRGGATGASEPAVVVVALLAVASGLFSSMAVRGALPAIAQLPWIGLGAVALVDAEDRRARTGATIVLALALGFTGLSGTFGAMIDGLVLAAALAARRKVIGYLALGIAAGIAIAAAQWVPALLLDGVGVTASPLPTSRLIELVLPGSFGASDVDRAVAAIAGARPWAPSIFVGAALFALAAVRIPPRRSSVAIGILVALAAVVGRGGAGWPGWLGGPEIHLAALVIVLAVNAAAGLDDLLAGKRRAMIALVVAAAFSAIALGSIAVLGGRAPAAALDRALIDGGIGLGCLALAAVLAWRELARPAILALLLLSSAGSVPSTAPTIARIDEPPAFAVATAKLRAPAPLRVYRPVRMHDEPESTEEAIGTFAGNSPWRWGVGAARSEDPARLPTHDRTWLAAAREGGALLDRFAIELAILPETLIVPRKLDAIARRGSWVLVKLPVAPAAAVLRGTLWSEDPDNALDLMYPTGGGTGVLRGTIVLAGRGPPAQVDRGPPLPCTIERWEAGAIDLACTTDAPGYAAVASSTAPGWQVTVDGNEAPWLTADVLRRAVAIEPGTHQIAWRYAAPGLKLGLVIAAIALLGLLALRLASRRSE